ncbi:MAG: class I tRNA ligase family protein, partial [Chloroflexota bacterium]
MTIFKPVSSKVSFPEMEERILRSWRERDMLRLVEQTRKDAPPFTLYEGPPTANGKPGIHHVLARVFKDVIPRYKTMQGFRPVRQGGWDTHGLPVELEIEKELGISSKREIEEYGIERFNALCKESVMRYVKEFEELTDRIGFWIDMPNAYVTFKNDYIETGWWIIKQLWKRGLLYEGFRVAPHCPRCVTTLSSHEVALGYQENTPDPSVYVRFRLAGWNVERRARRAFGNTYDRLIAHGEPVYFLAWTTTPWTLTANV